MRRLAWLMAFTLLLPGGAMAADARLDPAEWHLYLARYVEPEGRVVDAANGNIATSEGQGYALLLATAYDDRASFDKLWRWTNSHLNRPSDHLLSWKWVPGKTTRAESVPDANNATDGDLLIAWALSRASRLWHADEYRNAALAIEADLRSKMIRNADGLTLLLPGGNGFESDKKLVVNLSYWVFPALDDMATLSGQAVWKQVAADGMKLIGQSAFGRWGLPPDWLALKPKPAIAEGFAPWFGYNAIRIPLYLIWGGRGDAAHLKPYLAFWDTFATAPFTPGWTDVTTDGVDSRDAQPGFKAIMTLARAKAAGHTLKPSDLPALTGDQSYYSASLLLLSKLAAIEEP